MYNSPRGKFARSPETREKMRQAALGQKQSPAAIEKIRQANLGRKASPEAREKMSKALRGNQNFLGRHHSSESRAKIGQAVKGRRHSEAARKKIGEASRQRWLNPSTRAKMYHAVAGRKHSPETREKMRQARLRYHLPTKMTSIEQSLYNEFKKRRLKFEMHKSMFGRFQPDFVFESTKLIVQADGDYWHRMKPGAKEKDARFNAIAHAQDWTVWRFAESEIVQHPKACGRAVARFVRSHN